MAISPLRYRLSIARALSQRLDSQIKSVNSHTETDIVLTASDVGADAIGSADAVRDAFNKAITNYVLKTVFNQAVNNLQSGIDGKQPLGSYQPAGDYALKQALADAVASLQTAINTRQPLGDYALTSALNNAIATLNTAINGKQNIGDYALTSALNSAVATLQTAINSKQNAGDYALNSTLANYVLTSVFNTQVATLQTNIDGKQPLIKVAPSILAVDASTVIVANQNVIPFSLVANTTLTNKVSNKIGTANPTDGQSLILVNTSNSFSLVLPVLGGNRIIFPNDSLNLTFSAALNGWIAPGPFRKYACRVYSSVNIIIPAGNIQTSIPFDSTRLDTSGGAMRNASDNTLLIAPVSGYYRFQGSFQFSGAGYLTFVLRTTGGLTFACAQGSTSGYLLFPTSYFLNAGQSFAVIANSVNAMTLTKTNNYGIEFEMVLEGL